MDAFKRGQSEYKEFYKELPLFYEMNGASNKTKKRRERKMRKQSLERVLTIMVVVIMFVVNIPFTATATTKNEEDYIEIRTIEELYNIRNDLTANYILMNDIDLTEATAEGGEWDYDGRGWNPIGSKDIYANEAFSGIFDGNGHSIIGMRIEYTSNYPKGTEKDMYIGLFANVAGQIHDLTMRAANINFLPASTEIGATERIGVIAGENEGTIYNCSVSGIVKATGSYVGAIAAHNCGVIEMCYNTAQVVGKSIVGGIAGTSSGVVRNCYNTGTIATENGRAGGIVGVNDWGTAHGGEISVSYNVGVVSGSNYSSNAIASSNYGTITNCYYLTGTGIGAKGATALTEAQLKFATVYSGFDFENVWVLNSYANYPYAQLRNNVQDLDETVELIRVIAYPSKTEYLTNDAIDPTGGMFEAVYISGKTELLELTADMISGYDPTVIGEQTLTVIYGGQTDTFVINVSRRPEVTGIELISEPTQKEFVIGTAFDFLGAKVKVSYDNDTSEIIDVTEDMTTGGNINHIGSQTITVNCGGQMVTFEVKVVPASVSSIEITKLPSKLIYMEGEDIDLTGMALMATYSNGTVVQIKSGYKVTGYLSEPGVHKVTVEFAGQKATFDVTVNERVLANIEIKATPDKLDYVVGEELDLTGLLVVAVYENGGFDIITDYTVSELDGTAGSKVVTLAYKGKTASFIVNVAVKCVEKIEIIKMPVKLTYIENEALNVKGMIVKATYNDGEVKVVTDYELSGFSSLPGTHTVYVLYEGQVDAFDVNVTAKVLSDLKVTVPTKTTYEIGESFDATGLVVMAYYNNGQAYSVDNYAITGFDSNSAGAKEIKITFEGMTRSFIVTVVEKAPIETGGKVELGVTKARLGETVSVPVTITKNTGLSAFCHTITFDANALAFKSVTLNGGFANGTVVVNDEKSANGEITVLWFQATDVIESGVAYTLNFEVLETAVDGISDIAIAFDENDNGNASGENVLFEAINGSVDILSYWLGDLDGDRQYTMVDLLQLAQYVSGQTMTLTDKQKLSADVNEDGVIDIHDVTLLAQWLLAADM